MLSNSDITMINYRKILLLTFLVTNASTIRGLILNCCCLEGIYKANSLLVAKIIRYMSFSIFLGAIEVVMTNVIAIKIENKESLLNPVAAAKKIPWSKKYSYQ